MNKSIVLATLLFSVLVSANKAETTTSNGNSHNPTNNNSNSDSHSGASTNSDVLKNLETAPENSPWDPREKEGLSKQAQAEAKE